MGSQINATSLELNDGRLLLKPAKAAELMGVSVATVTSMCRSGKLPAIRIGKQWRIRRADLLEMLGITERGEADGVR